MKNFLFIVSVVMVLTLLVACGGSDEPSSSDAGEKMSAQGEQQAAAIATGGPSGEEAATVQAECSKCHGLVKVCSKVGSFDMQKWNQVVMAMVKKGAKVTPKQATTLVPFLAGGASGVCD